MAVGHFCSLHVGGHQLRPLAVGEGLHEQDRSVLKRLKPSGLRQDVPKGKRVLIVYDKAGIDFDFWKRCRHECAVYFLSRVKEGMVCYTEPETGRTHEDLTNEMDLPPGVVVELYRRRWELEKVFDEIKNKLWERKA